jgi:hypothetical protein
MMDTWDLVALIGFGLILVFFALFWFILWLDRNSPFVNTRANQRGRRRMASDWERPPYLPENWK